MEKQSENINPRMTVLNVKDNIVLSFNKPVEYIVLNKNKAMDLGSKLKKKAKSKKIWDELHDKTRFRKCLMRNIYRKMRRKHGRLGEC